MPLLTAALLFNNANCILLPAPSSLLKSRIALDIPRPSNDEIIGTLIAIRNLFRIDLERYAVGSLHVRSVLLAFVYQQRSLHCIAIQSC